MLPMNAPVDFNSERPAGRPGECFYCHAKIGHFHDPYCVLISQFPATATILNTETGERRECAVPFYEEAPGDEGTNEYMWTEGNYSCDCNRANFFGDDRDEVECGDYKYVVEKIVRDSTGEVLYEETA